MLEALGKHFQSLPMKWRIFFAALMIGLLVSASLSYIEYQSLNRMSAEYEQYEQLKELVELVKEGVTLRYDYTLSYGYVTFEPSGSQYAFDLGDRPWYCAVYSPYVNFTLDLNIVLLKHESLSEAHLVVSVQEGNAFTLGNDEVAPVIWSMNATETGVYSLRLASKGWYTISLIGPITNTYPFEVPFIEGISCSMQLKIVYKGNSEPFAVVDKWLPSLI